MARKVRITFIYVFAFIFFAASIYRHYLLPPTISLPPIPTTTTAAVFSSSSPQPHHLLRLPPPHDPIESRIIHEIPPRVAHLATPSLISLSTVSVLLPAWVVLVIVSADDTRRAFSSSSQIDNYVCHYPNNDVSPAGFAGFLRFPDRATFKCSLPDRSRRRLPFLQPVLTKTRSNLLEKVSPPPELLRWTQLVYDSLTTENDVVVFLKGLNNRQGLNRDPLEFNCVFFRGDDLGNGVRTTVTHSMQEVFRCQRPNLTAVRPYGAGEQEEKEGIKVSLEIVRDSWVVPTVAYYNPPRKLPDSTGKSLLCACTMVYNIAKVLKEWVYYHSKIGIERFILYDNGSDDHLENAVEELKNEGFDVKINSWLWQKTQEAGFSHAAVYARDACAWMVYIDVDEFLFSPSWLASENPSKSMLRSLLQNPPGQQNSQPPLGQISINCREFGPSNQTEHPVMGVTQGYNCRRQYENRHKSIVFLEGVDDSLLNVIHHFNVKPGYRTARLSIHDMVVNHYKFQAWPEFKAKFRRRVSAYVVDWTQQVNFRSNDRTPGLGSMAVEPKDWPLKFCEIVDNGLKELTKKWFAVQSPSGYKMTWQR